MAKTFVESCNALGRQQWEGSRPDGTCVRRVEQREEPSERTVDRRLESGGPGLRMRRFVRHREQDVGRSGERVSFKGRSLEL